MFKSYWYYSLIKPSFSPPDFVFMPVWVILYLMMFVSIIIYYKKRAREKASGYLYFFSQLFFNILWAPAFFGLKNIAFAFYIIIILDIFVLLTITKFYSVDKTAGSLLIPYFLWIIFATYLNIGYLLLN